MVTPTNKLNKRHMEDLKTFKEFYGNSYYCDLSTFKQAWIIQLYSNAVKISSHSIARLESFIGGNFTLRRLLEGVL